MTKSEGFAMTYYECQLIYVVRYNKMTFLLQGSFRDETQRINRAFDLMLGFQKKFE